jgi:hypothetical protein
VDAEGAGVSILRRAFALGCAALLWQSVGCNRFEDGTATVVITSEYEVLLDALICGERDGDSVTFEFSDVSEGDDSTLFLRTRQDDEYRDGFKLNVHQQGDDTCHTVSFGVQIRDFDGGGSYPDKTDSIVGVQLRQTMHPPDEPEFTNRTTLDGNRDQCVLDVQGKGLRGTASCEGASVLYLEGATEEVTASIEAEWHCLGRNAEVM